MLFAVQNSNAWLATGITCLVRAVSRDGGLDGKFLRLEDLMPFSLCNISS